MNGTEPVRIAAIGAGYVSRWQFPAWQQIEGTHLVAVCDRDQDRAQEAIAGLAARPMVFGDAEAMLEEVDVDAIDILTTPDTHLDLVALAADRGVSILCQKPLATSLSDAKRIVEIARDRSVRLMVNENFRWRPSFRWAADLMQGGALGRVFYAGFDSRINVTRPAVEWPRGRLFTYRPYFLEVDRLIVLENTIHWIDVSRFLFGEPLAVYCRTQRSSDFGRGEDTALVALEYPESTVVIQNAWGSYGYAYPAREAEIAIEGTNGTVLISRTGEGVLAKADGSEEPAPYDLTDYYEGSFRSTQAHFVESLRTGAEFETTGEDNLRTLSLTMAAYLSADEGRRVTAEEIIEELA